MMYNKNMYTFSNKNASMWRGLMETISAADTAEFT